MHKNNHTDGLTVKKFFKYSTLIAPALTFAMQTYAKNDLTVYAAASLTNAMNDLNLQFEKTQKVKVKSSYAASSTLARQIEAGAPADIFMSADEQWMNYLQQKNRINVKDRINLLGNRLVLITPKDRPVTVKFEQNFDISKAFKGKWCTGNTNSVPVGKYAKQALGQLGWWSKLQPRLVETEDVRAALNFVAKGECDLGIVYATDAAISRDVKVVGVFPITTHTPIVYPLGIVNKNAESMKFYQYLQSPQASAVFQKYGFTLLNHRQQVNHK